MVRDRWVRTERCVRARERERHESANRSEDGGKGLTTERAWTNYKCEDGDDDDYD